MRAITTAIEYQRTRPLRFWAAASASAIAVVVTVYLGVMTLLWGLHVGELRSVANDLTRTDADRRATLSAQATDLAAGETAQRDALGELRALAHTKALSEDQRYVYHDFALVLKDCADERAKVVTIVQQRYLYVTWTVHRYDDNVAEYCAQVKQAWAESLTEEDS